MVLVLVLLVFAMVSSSSAATTGSPLGVYRTKEAFDVAVEQTKAIVGTASLSTEEAKAARREAISNELFEAETIEKQEAVARKYGLVIYTPEDHIAPFSDGSDLEVISTPTITWDPFEMEYEFAGRVRWNNVQAIRNDQLCIIPLCDIGGFDAISLVFSNWPAGAYPTYFYTTGEGETGRGSWVDRTVDVPQDGNKMAFVVSKQDRLFEVRPNVYDYNFYNVRISVWVANWNPSVRGEAQTVYAHDWHNTKLQNVTFNATGSPTEAKVSAGLTFQYNLSINKWAKQGPTLRY